MCLVILIFIASYVQRVINVLCNMLGGEGVDAMTKGFRFRLLSDDDIPPHSISHPL